MESSLRPRRRLWACVALAFGLGALPAAAAPARRLTRIAVAPAPRFVGVVASPTNVGGTLFFPTWDSKNLYGMRASDGSSPRATVLRGGRSQAAVSFGGRAFFIGADATSSRLWESDGRGAVR